MNARVKEKKDLRLMFDVNVEGAEGSIGETTGIANVSTAFDFENIGDGLALLELANSAFFDMVINGSVDDVETKRNLVYTFVENARKSLLDVVEKNGLDEVEEEENENTEIVFDDGETMTLNIFD